MLKKETGSKIMLKKWTKEMEEDLQAGVKKGLKPALSEIKNVLACNWKDCNRVAWECFSIPQVQLSGNKNAAGEMTGTMLLEVFCSPEHQALRLNELDARGEDYLFNPGE